MVSPRICIILSLYRGERFLEKYLNNVLEQTIAHQIELSIVHNEPNEIECQILERFSKKIPIVKCSVQRENLYSSWNRALAQSTAPYVACWNVDDTRAPDSLERMAEMLDSNPICGWTYGDFVVTHEFCSQKGRMAHTPEWSLEHSTNGAIGGPFFMWRRSLMDKTGWFDEQFSSGGDFDFTVRLSLNSEGIRTPGILGYFLNERTGLSTTGDRHYIERTAIQLRYGIYQTIDWKYVPRALNMRVCHILQPDGHWSPIEQFVPYYDDLLDARYVNAWLIPYCTVKSAVIRQFKRLLA